MEIANLNPNTMRTETRRNADIQLSLRLDVDTHGTVGYQDKK